MEDRKHLWLWNKNTWNDKVSPFNNAVEKGVPTAVTQFGALLLDAQIVTLFLHVDRHIWLLLCMQLGGTIPISSHKETKKSKAKNPNTSPTNQAVQLQSSSLNSTTFSKLNKVVCMVPLIWPKLLQKCQSSLPSWRLGLLYQHLSFCTTFSLTKHSNFPSISLQNWEFEFRKEIDIEFLFLIGVHFSKRLQIYKIRDCVVSFSDINIFLDKKRKSKISISD